MTAQAFPLTDASLEWLAESAIDPAAVHSFCLRREILADVQRAVELVKQHLPTLEGLEIRLERDPEVEGEWLVLDVAVHDEVDSFLDAYDRCKEAWVATIPWRALSSICLVYSLR